MEPALERERTLGEGRRKVSQAEELLGRQRPARAWREREGGSVGMGVGET